MDAWKDGRHGHFKAFNIGEGKKKKKKKGTPRGKYLSMNQREHSFF